MQLTTTLLIAAATLASSASVANYEFPDFVPLYARQAEGSKGECHADCGYTIVGSADPTHCTNETWLGLLEDCLECALQFDIWKFYGDGVSGGAQSCGLDATPEAATSSSTIVSSGSPSATPTPSTSVSSSASTTPTSTPSTTSSPVPVPDSGATKPAYLSTASCVLLVAIFAAGGLL